MHQTASYSVPTNPCITVTNPPTYYTHPCSLDEGNKLSEPQPKDPDENPNQKKTRKLKKQSKEFP